MEDRLIRRIIAFLIGLSFVGLGIWWGYEQLFLYAVVHSAMLAAAASLIFFGGLFFWVALSVRR